jgi:integrase
MSPRNVNRKVTPSRLSNAAMRPREYLLKDELDAMLKTAKQGRYPERDVAMIQIAYRHGLRAQEIVDLEWPQVEIGRNARLHVRRVKKVASVCPSAATKSAPYSELAWSRLDYAHREIHRHI